MVQKIELLEGEVEEYFKDIDVKILSKRYTSHGVLVEYETNTSIQPKVEKQKKVVLYTFYNNSKMYYGKNGATFQKTEAQLFTKEQALSKIKFMKGAYKWEIETI